MQENLVNAVRPHLHFLQTTVCIGYTQNSFYYHTNVVFLVLNLNLMMRCF